MLVSAAVAASLVAGALFVVLILPSIQYRNAEALLESGDFDEAIAALEKLDDFKDSTERVKEVEDLVYSEAEALLASGDKIQAAIAFDTIAEYQDAKERAFGVRVRFPKEKTFHVVSFMWWD